ncbi:MAG: hypothetical protein GX797_04720, partial [Chloroflexi bacterium]|nr:hypothetical protein [Chloroflexota bacterium]
MAETKQNTGKLTKAKALELQKAQEAEEAKRKTQKEKAIRFAWDLAGLAMLMVGAVLLLALFDITQGKLVNSGVYLLKRWFGLGRFMVAGV